VSQRRAAKKARRRKRQAARGARWLADNALHDLVATQAAIATDLEAFDQRITERGWTFDEDQSDEEFAFWFFEPSATEVDGEDVAPATTIWMSADEDAEVVHLMLAGTDTDTEFTPDEFLERVSVIEAYRTDDPSPEFGDGPRG
jgi:hypothetical protein